MEITLKALPFDLDFHPSSHLVATGLITGRIHLFKYVDCPEPQQLWTLRPHRESCRGIKFINGGNLLVTVSPDCSIQATNVETGQPVVRLPDSHEAAINRVINLEPTTIATGDDSGTIKIWDTRQNTSCATISAHEDFVSDMEYVEETKQLLSVGGDGVLTVSHVRRGRVDARSEFSENELLSVVLAKNGRKVVCGSQEGVLLLYSWGEFGDCSDRFIGHPSSVDSLLKLDEETLISGSSDGLIRLVSILPNRITGVIGEHSDYPVERLAFSFDKQFLGSASHENVLKLWDLKDTLSARASAEAMDTGAPAASGGDGDGNGDGDGDGDDDEDMQEEEKRKRKGKQKVPENNNAAAFFADL